MRRNGRIVLWLLLCATFAATSYQSCRMAEGLSGREASSHVARARALRSELWALRNELQTATAMGRTEMFAEAIEPAFSAATLDVGAWLSETPDAALSVPLKNLVASLDAFGQNISQAKEFTTGGQRNLANEVVFTDGAEITRSLFDQLEAVEKAGGVRDTSSLDAVMLAWMALGAVGFIAVIALARPAFRADPVDAEDPAQPQVEPAAERRLDQPAAEAPTAPTATDLAIAHATEAGPPSPAPSNGVERTPGTESTREQWSMIASLCTELARVNDSQELGSVLDRALVLLNAKGVILWLWHPDEGLLRAILGRGYKPNTLGRLPPIARDELNTAALAFRTGELQVVPASEPHLGVIVAPVISASGCTGVLTAEIKGRREGDDDVQSMTRILAAQLATMVGGSAPERDNVAPEAQDTETVGAQAQAGSV